MVLKDVRQIISELVRIKKSIPPTEDVGRYLPDVRVNVRGEGERCGIKKALRLIEQAPTIDAVEVVHGRWENVTVEAYFVPTIEEKTKRDFPCCSRCHQIQSIAAWTKPFNYCPNCGAKMDGGAEK